MMRQQSVAIDTVPLPERPVRVTIPIKVAFDLKSMQRLTGSLLERLGCPNCHSGFDIRFEMATRFHVDQDLNIHESVAGGVVING